MYQSTGGCDHFMDNIIRDRRRPECLLVVGVKLTRGCDKDNPRIQGRVQTNSPALSLEAGIVGVVVCCDRSGDMNESVR